jgi:hypothetical protein
MDRFTQSERDHIYRVKRKLEETLKDFQLTVQKLGVVSSAEYFVSGGCIGSLLRNETPKDYDIYFKSEAYAKRIINLFTNDPSYMNNVEVAEENYRDVNAGDMMITENAITLKNGLQLITKHYGQPDQIRATFDFVHCKPYWDSLTTNLYISREQYDLNVNKKLKSNGQNFAELWRIEKYKKRGFTWQ